MGKARRTESIHPPKFKETPAEVAEREELLRIQGTTASAAASRGIQEHVSARAYLEALLEGTPAPNHKTQHREVVREAAWRAGLREQEAVIAEARARAANHLSWGDSVLEGLTPDEKEESIHYSNPNRGAEAQATQALELLRNPHATSFDIVLGINDNRTRERVAKILGIPRWLVVLMLTIGVGTQINKILGTMFPAEPHQRITITKPEAPERFAEIQDQEGKEEPVNIESGLKSDLEKKSRKSKTKKSRR